MTSERLPKMYTEIASWWPLLSPPSHYVEEAAFYERVLVGACDEPPRTLLELGSGGGNNASHLKARFEMALVDHGGSDGDTRSLRYLEWTWDPDPTDTTFVVDYAYMPRDGDGSVRVDWDRHVEGLFGRADWLRLLSEGGFEPSTVPFEPQLDPGAFEVFVGRKIKR